MSAVCLDEEPCLPDPKALLRDSKIVSARFEPAGEEEEWVVLSLDIGVDIHLLCRGTLTVWPERN